MQIDTVLTDPIILTEKLPITDSIIKSESRNNLYNETKSNYKINLVCMSS